MRITAYERKDKVDDDMLFVFSRDNEEGNGGTFATTFGNIMGPVREELTKISDKLTETIEKIPDISPLETDILQIKRKLVEINETFDAIDTKMGEFEEELGIASSTANSALSNSQGAVNMVTDMMVTVTDLGTKVQELSDKLDSLGDPSTEISELSDEVTEIKAVSSTDGGLTSEVSTGWRFFKTGSTAQGVIPAWSAGFYILAGRDGLAVFSTFTTATLYIASRNNGTWSTPRTL